MVPILSLWLPILLSAIFVFVVSSVIHMFLGYHANDYARLPVEDQVMQALESFRIPPGEYIMPYAGGMEAMKSPEFVEKANRGPVAFMTVRPNGIPGMGKNLALWFLYAVVVGIFASYIAGRALGPGTDYLSVFRFVGATAFIAYTVAGWQDSIWYHRAWTTTIKNTFDGLVYALLTAGTFGWLWPS
jgi:hypothetical protein